MGTPPQSDCDIGARWLVLNVRAAVDGCLAGLHWPGLTGTQTSGAEAPVYQRSVAATRRKALGPAESPAGSGPPSRRPPQRPGLCTRHHPSVVSACACATAAMQGGGG